MARPSSATILLTGSTGFLGKVVLEELLRRRHEYSLNRIVLLIRSSKKLQAQDRFITEVAPSPCFERLGPDWCQSILVVQGDLTEPNCGLETQSSQKICSDVTHIINCAACVAFDLPLAAAAEANVGSALNLIALAKACPRLQGMVTTSTSYVARFVESTITPALAPLPYPAEELYHDILNGRVDEVRLLKETSYPNTYCLTKCIAEHILLSRRCSLPLTIVRPSIISCSWKFPAPGWIDSKAAMAGVVALIGTGHLRVLDGSKETVLDVVPVDIVANDLIGQARLIPVANQEDDGRGETLTTSSSNPIVHSVTGIKNGLNVGFMASRTVEYFQDVYETQSHGKLRKPRLDYVGPRSSAFHLHEIMSHRLPLFLSSWYFNLSGKRKMARKTRSLARVLKKVNKVFPYFLHRSFDFEPGNGSFLLDSSPQSDSFTPERYADIICEGVRKHLLKR